MYEHVHGDLGRLRITIRVPPVGKTAPPLMGQYHSTYRCTYHGEQRNKRVNRRVNTLWTERQTTPRSG